MEIFSVYEIVRVAAVAFKAGTLYSLYFAFEVESHFAIILWALAANGMPFISHSVIAFSIMLTDSVTTASLLSP
jgi:hypothetical protein